MRLPISLLLLVSVVFAGCGPAHVSLAVPPDKNAPLEVRQEYYEEHRPMAVRNGMPYYIKGPGAFLLLENGTRVERPLDLLEVVDDTSPTARAALRAEEEEEVVQAWSLAAGGLLTGGFVVMLSSIVVPLVAERNPDMTPVGVLAGSVGLVLAGGALSMASIVPSFLAFSAATRGQLERDTAFLVYDRSLRERLNLSKDDVAGSPGVAVQNQEGAFELQ